MGFIDIGVLVDDGITRVVPDGLLMDGLEVVDSMLLKVLI